MKEWLEKLQKQPIIAHWVRAFKRFDTRLGRQFAAAITYFSVLSMVPILMVAFAGLGITVTVFNPDLLDAFKESLTSLFAADAQMEEQVTALVDAAFSGWQAVGIVGLLSALWTGSVWVRNVRAAVRALIRDNFDTADKPGLVLGTVKNMAVLVGFLTLLALTIGLGNIAGAVRDLAGQFVPLEGTIWGSWAFTLLSTGGTVLAGFLLFCFIFWALPSPRIRGWMLVKAGLMGGVGMALLQLGAGALARVFSSNVAASVFGTTIVIMLFFNLFATLILIIASWIGTDTVPEPTAIQQVEARPHHPTNYATKLVAARLEPADDKDTVPTTVAVNATRVGVGLGALGMGILAAVAAVFSGLRDR